MNISRQKDILKSMLEVVNNNSSRPYNLSSNITKNQEDKKIIQRLLLVNHEMDHESVIIIILLMAIA